MVNYLGYPLTNLREIIILFFLLFLYLNTNYTNLKYIYLIIFIYHFYKLSINYKINNKIYNNYKYETLFYNIILFSVLIVLFIKKTNNIFIIFTLLFITTRYLIQNLNKKINKININIIQEIFIILGSILGYILYPDYKYKFIFIIELINHIINLIINRKFIIYPLIL